MEYRNKTILAPMVRVGTLPMRMLAADYGADITYGEEIVDHKIVTCRREINSKFLVSYLNAPLKASPPVSLFSLPPPSRSNCLGGRARLSSLRLHNNSFRGGVLELFASLASLHALTLDHNNLTEALGTVDLVESATGIVVFRTCEEERQRVVFQIGTSDAVRALKAAELVPGGLGQRAAARGARAVADRQVPDRPKTPAKLEEIAAVAAALSIPVIANGDAFEYADFARIRSATRAAAVMVGRAAMWNPSVFRREGLVPWEQTKREYVRKAVEWDNEVKGTKHTLREMIMHHSNLEMAEGQRMYKCKTMADLCDMYDVRAYYDGVVAQRSSTSALLARQPGSVVKTFDSLQLDSDLASLKSCAAKLSPGGGAPSPGQAAITPLSDTGGVLPTPDMTGTRVDA
eukprot:jgi/Mesen1/1542/ME001330S00502